MTQVKVQSLNIGKRVIKIKEINILQISEKDNVVVILSEAIADDYFYFKDEKYNLKEAIPFGHKVALADFAVDDKIIKYGEIIGIAKENISRGSWIHNHNIISDRGRMKAGDK